MDALTTPEMFSQALLLASLAGSLVAFTCGAFLAHQLGR